MSGEAIEFPRTNDGTFIIGPDECGYENEKQVFYFAVLGMCGCGYPDESYNFILGILRLADRRPNRADRSLPWTDLGKAASKAVAADPDAAAHVLLHLLDTRNVLEHGSSVGGSWLSRLGEQIVDFGPATTELEPME